MRNSQRRHEPKKNGRENRRWLKKEDILEVSIGSSNEFFAYHAKIQCIIKPIGNPRRGELISRRKGRKLKYNVETRLSSDGKNLFRTNPPPPLGRHEMHARLGFRVKPVRTSIWNREMTVLRSQSRRCVLHDNIYLYYFVCISTAETLLLNSYYYYYD